MVALNLGCTPWMDNFFALFTASRLNSAAVKGRSFRWVNLGAIIFRPLSLYFVVPHNSYVMGHLFIIH